MGTLGLSVLCQDPCEAVPEEGYCKGWIKEISRKRGSSALLWSQHWSGHLQGIPPAVSLVWNPPFFFLSFLLLGFPWGY